MITVTRIELDDEQRQHLSRLLGSSKRLASRQDVTSFIEGCVSAALSIDLSVKPCAVKNNAAGSRVVYFRSLEQHLRDQGNYKGADIAARTVQELTGT